MEQPPAGKRSFTLYELNTLIKSTIQNAFDDICWVTAEIADLRCNQKGHCYLELVEKDGSSTIAQIKATIWAYEYRNLNHAFSKATGEPLKPGMKILLLAAVTFHEVYGLSINVRDIDPAYTMGEMARKKREVIERLTKEGIIDLNRGLPLPTVPQRIAVISSPAAAGYGDFFHQLDSNPYGYKFTHILFPAAMQGGEAEQSVIAAFREIQKKKEFFDIVVLIRGGGSVIDLNCFDSYGIASEIALFPLPVITGIGHERDDTVADIVAHTRTKTPTAVAEFLVSGMRGFEEKILGLRNRIRTCSDRFLRDERYKLRSLVQKLTYTPLRATGLHLSRILILRESLKGHVRQVIQKEKHGLSSLAQAVRHLDPAKVLSRGYSITRYKRRILKDPSMLKKWAVIETRLHKGTITSIVHETKEAKGREQEQATILLPGFE